MAEEVVKTGIGRFRLVPNGIYPCGRTGNGLAAVAEPGHRRFSVRR